MFEVSARSYVTGRWKRFAFLLVLLAPLLATVQGSSAQDEIVVRLVTNEVGLGDQNFNDLANEGGLLAAEELGITFLVTESRSLADYVPNLTAATDDSDLIIAIGFPMVDAVTEVALQFPDDQFLLIDAVAEADNVASAIFREQESAFLAGVVAGLMTESNQIGIVGGQRIPPVVRYEVGFVAGVSSVNPEADVVIGYADTFGDPALGRELTLAQFNQGVDIVFPIAGLTGIGSFDAAIEMGEGFWVIAVDADQSHLGPEHQLFVSVKGVDSAVYSVIEQTIAGEFEGGVLDLGLAEGAVGLDLFDESVPADVIATADQYEQAIIAGDIDPPSTDDELEAFEPVAPDALATPVP